MRNALRNCSSNCCVLLWLEGVTFVEGKYKGIRDMKNGSLIKI